MDQPHNRPVPTTMWGMTYALKGWGGTTPSPLLELLAVANAMASSLRLGARAVASATRPTLLLQQPSILRGCPFRTGGGSLHEKTIGHG